MVRRPDSGPALNVSFMLYDGLKDGPLRLLERRGDEVVSGVLPGVFQAVKLVPQRRGSRAALAFVIQHRLLLGQVGHPPGLKGVRLTNGILEHRCAVALDADEGEVNIRFGVEPSHIGSTRATARNSSATGWTFQPTP